MILALIFGIMTGSLLGLLGSGGSIVAVPVLSYALGLAPKSAIGTALVIVGLASLTAVIIYLKRGVVRLSTALVFGGIGVVASFIGARLARFVPGPLQLALFAILMLFSAFRMLTGRQPEAAAGEVAVGLARVSAAGVLAGLLTGFLGVGGGFIIVPTLALVARLSMQEAIGTSLVVITMNCVGGAFGYLEEIAVNPSVVAFGLAAVITAPLMGLVARRLDQRQLKVAFAVSLIGVALWMLWREVPHLIN